MSVFYRGRFVTDSTVIVGEVRREQTLFGHVQDC